jgi:hypothetical protein
LVIDDTFVREIASMQEVVDDAQIQQFYGVPHTVKTWRMVPQPTAEALKVTKLAALVEYLRQNRDSLALSEVMVLVDSPTSVRLMGPLHLDTRQREVLMSVTPRLPQVFPWGKYLGQEEMIIRLRAGFHPTPDMTEVLALCSTVSREDSVRLADDGVSQEVTVNKALRKGTVVTKPTYALQPFRTFPEITPPVSEFILRQNTENVAFTLFEADGGAWEIDACDAIAEWLRGELTEMSSADGDKRVTVAVLA